MLVPLYDAYDTRVSAVNASDNTSGYVGIGIVGLMIVGKTSGASTKDARYLNCFPSVVSNPITGKSNSFMVKRPGFGTFNTPAAGEKGYAVIVWTGQGTGSKVISAFGETNSTIYDSTTSLGAITGRCTGLTETTVGATVPTICVTSTDSTGWYYDTVTAVTTKIADADFPGNAGKTLAGTFAHMDGFACIMTTDGGLYASDLNSVTAWTATSFDTANAYPDMGIGCIRSKNFILAFGSASLQFFYNAGLTPFPLAKASAMTVQIGCVGADTIAQIGDTIFWVGSTPQGGMSVFQYDGTISRVSTSYVDSSMILAGVGNISTTTIRFYGLSFVLVKAASTTWAYCVENKAWHEWNSTTPLWYKCAGTSRSNTMVNYAVSNVDTSGKVFVMNHASLVYTDNGLAYTARIQKSNMDLGTNKRKIWQYVDIMGDIESSTSILTLSHSDDDYQTYVVDGTIDLSTNNRRFSRLGSSDMRSWVLTHSSATPMRLQWMDVQAKIGLS